MVRLASVDITHFWTWVVLMDVGDGGRRGAPGVIRCLRCLGGRAGAGDSPAIGGDECAVMTGWPFWQ